MRLTAREYPTGAGLLSTCQGRLGGPRPGRRGPLSGPTGGGGLPEVLARARARLLPIAPALQNVAEVPGRADQLELLRRILSGEEVDEPSYQRLLTELNALVSTVREADPTLALGVAQPARGLARLVAGRVPGVERLQRAFESARPRLTQQGAIVASATAAYAGLTPPLVYCGSQAP